MDLGRRVKFFTHGGVFYWLNHNLGASFLIGSKVGYPL